MKENEWIKINNEEDIKTLMNLYGGFHDGCIKEMRYESGMYVDNDLSMYPFNSKRNLYVLFQRQFKNPSVIEMLFEKIDSLNLNPNNEDYDGIISGAYMCFEENKILWFDYDYFKEEEGYQSMYNNTDLTVIKAASVKYRIRDNCLGTDLFYK